MAEHRQKRKGAQEHHIHEAGFNSSVCEGKKEVEVEENEDVTQRIDFHCQGVGKISIAESQETRRNKGCEIIRIQLKKPHEQVDINEGKGDVGDTKDIKGVK